MKKKLNKKQQQKFDTIKQYLLYADREYGEKTGLNICGDDSHMDFAILYELKFNRLGLRARGWDSHHKEIWHSLENEDITVIYRDGLKYDSSFAYFLMCRDKTPESEAAYQRALKLETALL